jgi:hypothetical protein
MCASLAAPLKPNRLDWWPDLPIQGILRVKEFSVKCWRSPSGFGSHVKLVLIFMGNPKSALLVKIAGAINLHNGQRHGF